MRLPFVVAILAAGAAALSCREPTQVTLELSTNAACATEPLAPLMLLETGIVAGTPAAVARPDAAANTTTTACSAGDIGTVVLYPEDGALDAAALVIGRLHAENDPGSIERCIQFANPDPNRDPSLPPIDGSNCILARRRVAFIEHVPLRLPIRLDVACAGVFCGADQTCVADELGARCVSAEVSCTESGTCTDPGAAGGGVGGSGGDGTGGAGGEGGVTVTEVDGQGSFRHVAGVDETGTVYALHVDRLGSVLYEVLGTQVEGLFTESPPPTTSVAMHAALFDGIEVVAWDHDLTVRVWDGSPSQWAGASQPADFVLEGPDGRFALLRTNEYVVDVFIGGLPTQTCGVPMVGAPLAFARSGGEYFMVGEELCTCAGACLTLNGQLPWVDVSARRDVPVAVGVTQIGVWTWNAQSTLDQVDLIASTDEGQLGNVHVTPSGDVWVAATVAASMGDTYVARGTVSASGVLGSSWSSVVIPDLGGVRSLWAADGPAPTAWVVTNEGRLFRIEGL